MTVFNGILAERLATVIFPVSQAIVLIVLFVVAGAIADWIRGGRNGRCN